MGEVWNEAKDMWPHEPFEENIKRLVSIGTGVPSPKPFRKNLLETGHTLLAIATENGEDGGKICQAKLRARG